MKWFDRIVTMSVLLSGVFIIFLIVFLGIVVTQPSQGWFHDFRLFGLLYNAVGAFLSVIPRALRDKKDIEALSKTWSKPSGHWSENPNFKAFLLRDTQLAQIGMIIFGLGFSLQLVGNLG